MIISLVDEPICANSKVRYRLMRESTFICEHLERELKKRKIKYGCSRLNFNCKDNGNIREGFAKCEGLGQVDIPFDIKYYSMDKGEKISYICYLLICGFEKYCNLCNMDITPVKEILAEMKERNYLVDFYALKPCRRGDYTAKLYCIQDMENANFYVELYQKGKLIKQIPFYKTLPGYLGYFSDLGKLEWLDDDTVCLYSHPNYPDNNRTTKVLKVK